MMGDVYRIIVKGNHINGTGQKGSAMATSPFSRQPWSTLSSLSTCAYTSICVYEGVCILPIFLYKVNSMS